MSGEDLLHGAEAEAAALQLQLAVLEHEALALDSRGTFTQPRYYFNRNLQTLLKDRNTYRRADRKTESEGERCTHIRVDQRPSNIHTPGSGGSGSPEGAQGEVGESTQKLQHLMMQRARGEGRLIPR